MPAYFLAVIPASSSAVIPAKAGIQSGCSACVSLAPRLSGGDALGGAGCEISAPSASLRERRGGSRGRGRGDGGAAGGRVARRELGRGRGGRGQGARRRG